MNPPGTDRMGDSQESSGRSAPKSDQKFDGPPSRESTVKKTLAEYTSQKNQQKASKAFVPTSASPRVDAEAPKPSSGGDGVPNRSAQAAGSSDLSLSQSKSAKRRNKNKRKQSTPVGGTKRDRGEANLSHSGITPTSKNTKTASAPFEDLDPNGEAADALEAISLAPLSKEEEDDLLKEDDLDSLGEEGPPAKKSYSTAAKQFRGVLKYVHSGTDERLAITREQFRVLCNRVDMELASSLQAGKPEPSIRWRSWTKNRGLILFEDEESAKTLGDLIAKIKVKSTSFRLWGREEKPLKLVRGPLPDFARGLEPKRISDIIKLRNDLPGEILDLRVIEPKGKTGQKNTSDQGSGTAGGPSLSFSCDEVMWEALLSRSVKNKGKQIDLKVSIFGYQRFGLHTKKAEGAAEASATVASPVLPNKEA